MNINRYLVKAKPLLLIVLFSLSITIALQSQPVNKHGQLSVSGTNLQNKNGQTIQLRGQSFGWHNWWPQYYNKQVVQWLYDDWCAEIIRPAMGIEPSGAYLTNPSQAKSTIKTVVDGAIATGVYVIIDWHAHDMHKTEAISFFEEMAQTYGAYPNVIYELFNEPDSETWPQVKSYAIDIINAIRKYDPDNIIVVGCPEWDQRIDLVANDPIVGQTNIMYSVHFYANSHGKWLRDRTLAAINKGIPVIITESSGSEASGQGAINYTEWQAWFDFMDQYKITWLNYSVSDKSGETISVLTPGAPSNGGWTTSQLTESGKYVRSVLKNYCSISMPPPTPNAALCKATSPPVIDGIAESNWTSILANILTKPVVGTMPSAMDLSANFKANWDNNALYLLVTVTDDVLNNDSGTSPWDDDAVELFMDGNNDKTTTYDANDHQYIFRYNDLSVYEYKSGTAQPINPAGITFSQGLFTGGYIMEIKITWAALGIAAPASGKLMGLDVKVNDDDNGGTQANAIAWNTTGTTSYTDPSSFGTIQLNTTTCTISTGIVLQEAIKTIRIYPNPSQHHFNLDISPDINIQNTVLLLSDIYGREVRNLLIEKHTTTITNERLNPGIYFFRVINNSEIIETGRIVVL